MRAACAALALAATAALCGAADVPPDITPEGRADALKEFRKLYEAEAGRWRAEAEDARTLTKFPATENEGINRLAVASKKLADLEREPWRHVPELPVHPASHEDAKGGDIVFVPPGEYVGEKVAGGVLVEGLVGSGRERRIVRLLVASPLKLPEAKGKRFPPVTLPGLWYFAGTHEVGGKRVIVLYRFEVKKADLGPKK